ncbi:MAG: hypothetical protein AAFR16_05580, partial [Pseudomonadota bacterium]
MVAPWSADAAADDGVRGARGEQPGQADPGDARRQPPTLFFRRLQAADLVGWTGRPEAPAFQRLAIQIAAVAAGRRPTRPADEIRRLQTAEKERRRLASSVAR